MLMTGRRGLQVELVGLGAPGIFEQARRLFGL